jgi:hypothetical protein
MKVEFPLLLPSPLAEPPPTEESTVSNLEPMTEESAVSYIAIDDSLDLLLDRAIAAFMTGGVSNVSGAPESVFGARGGFDP